MLSQAAGYEKRKILICHECHQKRYKLRFSACWLQVWHRLQRIESLAEQISAAQAGKGPAPDSPLPLNTLNHNNKAARIGDSRIVLLPEQYTLVMEYCDSISC